MHTRKTVYKYRVIFSKKEDIVYISHLDLMTLLRRGIRRSELPFVLTGGFTPRVKLSIPEALKLGKPSENEEMVLWLSEKIPDNDIANILNSKLPRGVRIENASYMNESVV